MEYQSRTTILYRKTQEVLLKRKHTQQPVISTSKLKTFPRKCCIAQGTLVNSYSHVQ